VSFLSIAFLAALPLAAAPILLHLFDRRRNVTIKWGAMEFLLEASTRKTSARKLKQWLLLLLRVLAVATLVLALARPMLPGNWLGTNERRELILVLDNSMSTQRSTDAAAVIDAAGSSVNGSDRPGENKLRNTAAVGSPAYERLFDQIIERAKAELADLKPGDTVRILAASPYPVWATAGSFRVGASGQELVYSQLESVRPTSGGSDLLAALFTAVQADAEPVSQKRRVVLITDGQAADWTTEDDKGWRRFQDVLQTAQLPTELDIVEVTSDVAAVANVAVNHVESSRTVVGVDQAFTATAQIKNHSRVAADDCSVRWLVNGNEEHRELVSEIGGGESSDAVWHHSFANPGVYAISCSIDANDRLAADNMATVVVEVVNEVPVLVVESAAGRAEMQQDAYFVMAAMGYVDGEPLESRGVHHPETVTPVGLERTDLSSYRAIVIPNLKSLSKEAIEKLNQYVFDGGGLWLALGPRTDIEVFNQYLFADGEGLAPLALDGIVAEADTDKRKTTINPSLRDHPATKELTDAERLDTSDVKISRRVRFVPPPQDQDVSILLSLTNGEPLAVEKYFGSGRVIVQSVPLRMDQWSDIAKSQAFVVMVQDWLSYLTAPQATRHNLSPGDPIAVQLSDAENTDGVLRTPHGDEIELTADAAGDGVIFRSSRTILSGDYSLELSLSGERLPFHVQRSPRESDLAMLTAEDHKLLADTAGLEQDLLSNGMGGSSHSDPVWPLLLMLLIAFMSAELLLAGLISRERFGSEAIAESSGEFASGDIGLPMAFGNKAVMDSVGADRKQEIEV